MKRFHNDTSPDDFPPHRASGRFSKLRGRTDTGFFPQWVYAQWEIGAVSGLFLLDLLLEDYFPNRHTVDTGGRAHHSLCHGTRSIPLYGDLFVLLCILNSFSILPAPDSAGARGLLF